MSMFDIQKLAVDSDGRVIISDAALIDIESRQLLTPFAGGYDGDAASTNENFCANSRNCAGSSNGLKCRNTGDCTDAINISKCVP